VFLPDTEVDGIEEQDGWDVIVPREKLPFHFEPKCVKFDHIRRDQTNIATTLTRLQRLLDIPADYQRIRLFHRECAEDWTDESGRLLLIGEAAHPLYVRHPIFPIDYFMRNIYDR